MNSIKERFTDGSGSGLQSVQSLADTASGTADDSLKSVSDSIANTVNASTPQDLTLSDDSALSAADIALDVSSSVQEAAPTPVASSPTDALTSVTDSISDAASKAAEQVSSLVSPEAKEAAAEATPTTWRAEDLNTVADAGSSAYIAADTEKPSQEVPTTEVADTASKAGDAAQDLAGQVAVFLSAYAMK